MGWCNEVRWGVIKSRNEVGRFCLGVGQWNEVWLS